MKASVMYTGLVLTLALIGCNESGNKGVSGASESTEVVEQVPFELQYDIIANGWDTIARVNGTDVIKLTIEASYSSQSNSFIEEEVVVDYTEQHYSSYRGIDPERVSDEALVCRATLRHRLNESQTTKHDLSELDINHLPFGLFIGVNFTELEPQSLELLEGGKAQLTYVVPSEYLVHKSGTWTQVQMEIYQPELKQTRVGVIGSTCPTFVKHDIDTRSIVVSGKNFMKVTSEVQRNGKDFSSERNGNLQ